MESSNNQTLTGRTDDVAMKILIFILIAFVSCEYIRVVIKAFDVFYAKLYLSSLLIFGSGLFLFLAQRSGRIQIPQRYKIVTRLILALQVWILIRVVTTEYFDITFPALTYVNSFSGYLAFAWTAPLVSYFRLERYTIWVFCMFSGMISIIGILHTALLGMPIGGEVSILNGNHMHIGLYMLLTVGCASYLMTQCEAAWQKILLILVIFLAFVSIALSGSRAATIGVMMVVVMWVVMMRSMKIRIVLLAFVVAGYLVFSSQQQDRVEETNSITLSNGLEVDYSMGYRFFMWYGVYNVIISDPSVFWFGLGFEALQTKFNELIYFPIYVNAAHNIYLQVWTELGLVGFVLFFGALAALFVMIWRSGRVMRITLIPAFLGIMATGLVQESLYANMASANFNTAFYFMVGVLILWQLRISAAETGESISS